MISELRKLTTAEYSLLEAAANKIPFTRFAKFMFAAVGYRFETKRGTKLHKWEAFYKGQGDFDKILKGKTAVVAIKN